MADERDNSTNEPWENNQGTRGRQRRGGYGLDGHRTGGRGSRSRLSDSSVVRPLRGMRGSAGRRRGASIMGRRVPGPRPVTTNHIDTTVSGISENRIPAPNSERSGSFDMSDLWSTLPRDSQHHPSGPAFSYPSHENDQLSTGQDDGSRSSIASEADLVNRLEGAFRNDNNATCLHILEDLARSDYRLGALLLQSSSYYDLLSRQFEASQHAGRQAMDDDKKRGKIFFLLRKGLQDGYIGTEDERELFGLLAELHLSASQNTGPPMDLEKMQE